MRTFEIINQDKILVFKNVKASHQDYSGKNLIAFYISDSQFDNCQFENLTVKCMYFGGGETQSFYYNCSFDRSILNGPTGGNARFENCSFKDISITDFFFHKCEFINCIFTGKLNQIMFQGRLCNDDISFVNRNENAFLGNDFSQAKFDDVRFKAGIDLSKQSLPTQGNYILISNAKNVFEEFKKTLISSTDENLKKNAWGLYKTLEKSIVEDGQHQYFLELENHIDRKVYDLLIKIIEEFKD